jgi:hypothetical protein
MSTKARAMADRIVFDKHPLLDPMDTPLTRWIDETIRERSMQLAKQREDYCRELLHARLPCRLHWLIDRPKLLKQAQRFVPRWQPSLTFVNLNHPQFATGGLVARATFVRARKSKGMTAKDATHLAKVALHGAQESGAGFVFTYTDPSGLPAEVYGPVK